MSPGAKVAVKVWRGAQEKPFTIELAEKPNPGVAGRREPAKANPDPDVLDGVTVSDVDAQSRKEFNVPEDAKGAVVTQIDPDSPCAAAGIKVGDVIQEIDRKPVTDAGQAVDLSEQVKKERKVLLLVATKGASRFVMVERKE